MTTDRSDAGMAVPSGTHPAQGGVTANDPALAPPRLPRRRTPDLARIGEPARAAIDAGRLPSAVIGVSDAWGPLHLQALAGPSDRPRTSSLYYLASITKTVTATALMQLVDEARMDLDAPLVGILPELAGGPRATITARHVLTHSSGLTDMPAERIAKDRPGWDRILALTVAQEPRWTPGSRFDYVTDPFVLLGEAIARRTGMPYPEALATRLLRPLGMAESGFDVRPYRSRLMPVHGLPMRNPLAREVMLRFAARSAMPGAGLFSTAEDLLRYGRALLPRRGQDGPRVLSQARIDEMLTEQTAGIPDVRADGTVHAAHYALGWGKRLGGTGDAAEDADAADAPTSPRAATHGGASGTRLVIDPDRELVFVFLSHTWFGDEEPAWRTWRRVVAAWDAESAAAG